MKKTSFILDVEVSPKKLIKSLERNTPPGARSDTWSGTWLRRQMGLLSWVFPKPIIDMLRHEPMRTVLTKSGDDNWRVTSVRRALFLGQSENVLFSGPWTDAIEYLSKRSALKSYLSPIEIQVPKAQCLTIKRSLPGSALSRAKDILTLEFQRVSPLKMEDVYLDVVAGQESVDGRAEAQLYVLKRQVIASELAQLQERGVGVFGISLGDENESKARVNFLSDVEGRQTGPVEHLNRATCWLAVLLAASAVAYFATETMQLYQANIKINHRLEDNRKSAVALRSSLKKTDQSMILASSVRRQRIENPQFVALLDELTRRLPDQVWISSFSFFQQQLVLKGSATSSAGLISILSKSAHFSDAEFVGPITRNPDTNREQFQLRLNVRAPSDLTSVSSSGDGDRASNKSGQQ